MRNAQGQVAGFVTILSDITERKRAEEALQKAHDELEQRVKERTAELAKANEELDTFRRFAGDAEDGFGMSDFDGRIVYANPALCRLFGEEKPEDVIGRSVFAYYPEEYVQRRNDELIPALLREGHLHLEQVVLPRRGKPIRTLQSSFLIRDENEDPFRVGVVISDVTAQKQAEEALQRQHQTLKNLLRSSDHERQLIAYEIHDGLAQQLAGAIMQFETFDYLKDKDPKEAAEACHAGLTMLRQGHFEARRLIAGVRPPVLDESGVVEAVAHLVHEVGRDKRLKIENRSRVDFGRLDPTLENAVYRIVQEALTNACLHSKSARVSVGLVQRGDRLRIEVRDWGAGFDPKAVPKDRFGLEGIRQRQAAVWKIQHPKHGGQGHPRHRRVALGAEGRRLIRLLGKLDAKTLDFAVLRMNRNSLGHLRPVVDQGDAVPFSETAANRRAAAIPVHAAMEQQRPSSSGTVVRWLTTNSVMAPFPARLVTRRATGPRRRRPPVYSARVRRFVVPGPRRV